MEPAERQAASDGIDVDEPGLDEGGLLYAEQVALAKHAQRVLRGGSSRSSRGSSRPTDPCCGQDQLFPFIIGDASTAAAFCRQLMRLPVDAVENKAVAGMASMDAIARLFEALPAGDDHDHRSRSQRRSRSHGGSDSDSGEFRSDLVSTPFDDTSFLCSRSLDIL